MPFETSGKYDVEDSVTKAVTRMAWDASVFTYGTNGYYGDNTSDDTYTLNRDGFYNAFVKLGQTQFNIVAIAHGIPQRIRFVSIDGKPV